MPPNLPPAPPRPPANESIHQFTTANARYYLFKSKSSWTTAQEVCRSRSYTLASWPTNQELYDIFAGGWEPTYAPEFWVGVIRRTNSTTYEFSDGGTVPAIDGTPIDDYVVLYDPACTTDVRGCCATLTDRMVGPFLGGYQTARSPRLIMRSCLSSQLYLCKGALPPSPPPPSPPARPLSGRVVVRFNMDYLTLSTTPGRVNAFKQRIAELVAKEYSTSTSAVSVYELYQDAASGGLTVVGLLVALPDAITDAAAANYLFRLVNSPSIIFDTTFRATYLVSTPIQATLVGTVDRNVPPPAGVAQSAPGNTGEPDRTRAGIIGGLVGGIGLALVFVAVVLYVRHTRRRAALKAVQEIH